jgi:hypothetical protein
MLVYWPTEKSPSILDGGWKPSAVSKARQGTKVPKARAAFWLGGDLFARERGAAV